MKRQSRSIADAGSGMTKSVTHTPTLIENEMIRDLDGLRSPSTSIPPDAAPTSITVEVVDRAVRQIGCYIGQMITGPLIAEIAALVGEPARATMLSALLDGRALTASELAYAARVTPANGQHAPRKAERGRFAVANQGWATSVFPARITESGRDARACKTN
jgi:hypothetical protein